MLKKLFGKKNLKKALDTDEDKELSIEDLITLENYDEALHQLKLKVKQNRKDLHAHLKIAEVHLALKDVTKALDEYTFVADSYADDGFYDKAIALLSKAAKIAPGDDQLPRRIERYKRQHANEKRRSLAIAGLKANPTTVSSSAGNQALQIEILWNKIIKSHLVEQLDADMLKKLFSVVLMTETKKGEVIAKRGSSEPQAIFLIISGEISAAADVDGQHLEIRTFSTGDLIGDGALLERKSWPADYTVTQGGTVFRLDREGLATTMQGNPDPRGYISILRQQNNDRDVAQNLLKLSR